MKAITELLIFSIFFFYVNNQVPNDKSINSCGQIYDYTKPTNKDQCRGESGDICCFVQLALKADTTKKKRFCAAAPSMISKKDIEGKIEDLTEYTLEDIQCSNSKYIQIGCLFLLFFMLF